MDRRGLTGGGSNPLLAVALFSLLILLSAVLLVDPARWVSMTHLGEAAAELKRLAKQRGDGTILAGVV